MIEALTCQTCGIAWTREIVKGRKPKLCEGCKDDPTQVRKKQILDDEEKRRIAADRAFALDEALKARGTHVGQQDILAQLKERITTLEKKVESLEEVQESSRPGKMAAEDDGSAKSNRAVVHRKSRKGAKE